MKYAIIQDIDSGLEFPVFCLAPRTHEEMATAWRPDPQKRRVVSAGFCYFTRHQVTTYGHSQSLNLGPRQDDARIIAAYYRATLLSNNPDNHLGSSNTVPL